jgi:DNA repair photolyase
MEGYPEVGEMGIAAMKKINEAGIKCTVLTKGILPRSLEELSKENEYGITLVSLDEAFREKYEPHTASLQKRLNALKDLHKVGCKTWVSVEPYPTPNIVQQDLMILLEAVSFVDRIIFGRMNYNKQVSEYAGHKEFYNDCATLVSAFCREKGIDLHIKEGTIS